jgi:HD-GYP domain-containing protein (c-di-GMP phosphodiesterase class II)
MQQGNPAWLSQVDRDWLHHVSLQIDYFCTTVEASRPEDYQEELDDCMKELARACPEQSQHFQRYLEMDPDLAKLIGASLRQLRGHSSEETYRHILRVTALTLLIAEAYNANYQEAYGVPAFDHQAMSQLCAATLLHDIGKQFTPESILYPASILHPDRLAAIKERLAHVENVEETQLHLAPEILERAASFQQMPLTRSWYQSWLEEARNWQWRDSNDELHTLFTEKEWLHLSERRHWMEGWEYDVMKCHALHTAETLNRYCNGKYRHMSFIASSHHEAMDGTGYPFGLKGEQIPLESRIMQVADIYEARTADRSYRKAQPAAVVTASMASDSKIDTNLFQLAMQGSALYPSPIERFAQAYGYATAHTLPDVSDFQVPFLRQEDTGHLLRVRPHLSLPPSQIPLCR